MPDMQKCVLLQKLPGKRVLLWSQDVPMPRDILKGSDDFVCSLEVLDNLDKDIGQNKKINKKTAKKK